MQDLGALKSRLDPIVFYWRNERGLRVVMCSHVNGFIYRGNKEFEEEVVGRLKERLKEGSEEVGDFKYIGVEIRQEKDKIVMSQRKYSMSMREVPKWRFRGDRKLEKEEQSMYRSIIGQLNWLVQHSRPDLAVGMSLGSKRLQGARASDMRKLIKLIEKARENVVEVKMGRLEKE